MWGDTIVGRATPLPSIDLGVSGERHVIGEDFGRPSKRLASLPRSTHTAGGPKIEVTGLSGFLIVAVLIVLSVYFACRYLL